MADPPHGVADKKPKVAQRLIPLGSVFIVVFTVELMVNGPMGRERWLVNQLGLGGAYSVAWSVLRWPLLLAIVVGFLICLYRFTPNVRQTWRDCLPGAVLGALLWILAAVAFRILAALGLRGSGGVAAEDAAVQLIGQSVNAVGATVLWAYMASVAILLGGEFNAILRERRERVEP